MIPPTRIVIFAKAPVAGAVKTRLVPALGEEGAAKLAAEMLALTVREVLAAGLGEPELCAAPPPGASEWDGFRPGGLLMTDQGEGDLGERLARATKRALADRHHVLLVGADCPELDAPRLRAAAEALASHEAVMHPAHDGGYALLGLTRFDPLLFTDMAWSTAGVGAETLSRIRALGWSVHVGETLHDIDEPADLEHLAGVPALNAVGMAEERGRSTG